MLSNLSAELSLLNFKTVYWVDDENILDADVRVEQLKDEIISILSSSLGDDIRATISKMPDPWKKSLIEIAKCHDGNLKKPISDRVNLVKIVERELGVLEETSDNFRGDLLTMLTACKGRLSSLEKRALIDIFEPACAEIGSSWHSYSFTDWERKQNDILSLHNANNPALVLLDQQNTRDSSSLDGNEILKTVCLSKHAEGFRFFFITNTCEIDGEFKHASNTLKSLRIISRGISPPLFSISKSRLKHSVEAKPGAETLDETFVSLLRRLRISDLSIEISELLANAFEKANKTAFALLKNITLHEFLYAVTQSSQIEGVSELDTLLRLVHIQQREALVDEIVKSLALKEVVRKMRSIPTDVREAVIDSNSELKRLRSREVYWHPDAINSLYQPIANGDIFEVTRGQDTQHFVLVANDCDLMLRQNGSRKLDFVMLFEVASKKGGDAIEATLSAPIPTYSSRTTIELNRHNTVSTLALDLCWLNEDGALIWNNRKLTSFQKLPLLQSQHARLKVLQNIWTSKPLARAAASSLPGQAREQTATRTKIVLPFKRVARLNSPYAQGLLAKVANAMSRPSYEHDFSPKGPSVKLIKK